MNLIIQELHAPNTQSGNPRRLLMTYSPNGHTRAYDQGYAGARGVMMELGITPDQVIPTIDITATEYRRKLKQFGTYQRA